MVTIVPGTLFIGHVFMLRASSTTMSASLPGVSVPTLSSRRFAAAPAMVAISITCREVTSCGIGKLPGLLSLKARSLANARCMQ